jgi:hypothetical protein
MKTSSSPVYNANDAYISSCNTAWWIMEVRFYYNNLFKWVCLYVIAFVGHKHPMVTVYIWVFQKLVSLAALDVLGVLFGSKRVLFVLNSSQINLPVHIQWQCNEHVLGLLPHQHLERTRNHIIYLCEIDCLTWY